MLSETPVLLDRGSTALAHQSEVDDVRNQLKIPHNYFDCWIYGFLENKNFNKAETVAKLRRRDDMEKSELEQIEITDWMKKNMAEGIIQVIGADKEGRVVFYVRTARDKPSKNHRAESRKVFDMFVSYGTRLRAESKRCQLVMLINQQDASLWSNVDMSFQADIALRIAKFYPGCVDKMYICNMNRALSAVTKPLFSRLPAIVSDRIKIISASDIKSGKLLELFDESVLPIEMGGKNECDKQELFDEFSDTMVRHFQELQEAIRKGYSVKEWELMKIQKSEPNVGSPYRGSRFQHSMNYTGGGLMYSNSFSSMEDGKTFNDSLTDPQLHTCVSFDGQSGNVQRYIPTTGFDFMESMENFFRASIIEGYEREWMEIVKAEFQERTTLERQSGALRHDVILDLLPPSIRLWCRGFLWVCMTVMALFFLLSSIMVSIIAAVNTMYVFFSTLYAPYYIFPYGILLSIICSQFTMLVSRGLELAGSMFSGELIRPLRGLGYKAHVVQILVCVICVLLPFISFMIAFSAGGYTAFTISCSIGCLITACWMLLFHFIYAFGFQNNSSKSISGGGSSNIAEATIYFFLDVVIDEYRRRRPTTELIVFSALLIINFAFGLAFILSGNVAFLCVTIFFLVVLFYGVVVSLSIIPSTASSAVALNSSFFTCTVWLHLVFLLSQSSISEEWIGSVVVSILVAIIFMVPSYTALFAVFKRLTGLWVFRIAWITLLALHVGCLVTLYTIDYKAGLFGTALGIHLMICVIRTENAVNYYGALCFGLCFVIMLITCCLDGRNNISETYDSSVSNSLLPDFDARLTALRKTVARSVSPLCQTFFPGLLSADATNIVGASLFAKLANNVNSVTQAQDLAVWFPSFKSVGSEFQTSTGIATQVFHSSAANLTFITVSQKQSLTQAIETATLFLESYALSPLSVIIPSYFLINTLKLLSFLKGMSTLSWGRTISELNSFLTDFCTNSSSPNGSLYIVGYNGAGAIAGLLLENKVCSSHAVSFSVPSSFPILLSDTTLLSNLSKRLISVNPVSTLIFSWIATDATQALYCPLGLCESISSVARNLDALCMQ